MSQSTSVARENAAMLFCCELQKCFVDHKTSPDFSYQHEGEQVT